VKKKTLVKTLIGVIVIGGGLAYFMYQAMQSSWAYYYSVDEFSDSRASVKDYSLRIAGKVKPGSVRRDVEKMRLTFTLAGSENEVPISYTGSTPDNFAEDAEVVVQGRLDTGGVFRADTLLTRCESKYKAKLE
jgi:cytochrome c-type biogenesis protein CcmE